MREATISHLATALSQLSNTIYGDRYAIVAQPNSTIEIQPSQSASQENRQQSHGPSVANDSRITALSIRLTREHAPNEYLRGVLTNSPLIESWEIMGDQLLVHTNETLVSTVTLLVVGVLMTGESFELLQINPT